MYVHGGRDLREGSVGDMWRLDLDSLMRACEDQNIPVQWEAITYKGPKSPGSISHHKCGLSGDKMILIGGLKGETSNKDTWLFDLKTNSWELSKPMVNDKYK